FTFACFWGFGIRPASRISHPTKGNRPRGSGGERETCRSVGLGRCPRRGLRARAPAVCGDREGTTRERERQRSPAWAPTDSPLAPRTRFVSMCTPGPMVVESVTVFRYLPLAADGLARRISSITAR